MKHYDHSKPQLEPAIFVIFGITGDLAQRKLLPALYHLIKDGLLHEHTEIVGLSRREISDDELIDKVKLCVLEADNICDASVLAQFKKHLRLARVDPVNSDDYQTLHQTLDDIETKHGMCMNRLYYLSIPPQVYAPVIANLGAHGLNKGCQHHNAVSRLLVEKPFGYDRASAEELIEETARHFHEDQVFRIDHYLAKETVQNILVFRAQNPVFASLWDKQHIASIELALSEQIGVEGRAGFYDNVGALRDVVQNHLLQLLALVAMELPKSLGDSQALHTAKQKLLESIPPLDMRTSKVIRAQYEGYREEVMNPHSATETYVSLELGIDTPRWQDVPIRITTGKALASRHSTIVVTFGAPEAPDTSNKLTFRIQPNEGIDVELIVKRPGFDDKTELVQMDFSYHGAFGTPHHPDAYERVLVDAVRGDHSLFASSEEVLASWRILQPVLTAWEQGSTDLLTYKPGSSGPKIDK